MTHYFISTHTIAASSSAEGRRPPHGLTLSVRLRQIWCAWSGGDNQTRYYVNKTVDGKALSTVLKGLMPVLYQVEVAAVTRAGVGARSQPVPILISESAVTQNHHKVT